MSHPKPNGPAPIDSSPIPSKPSAQHTRTQKQRSKYLKQLRTAQRSLDHFKNHDLPQFEQWHSQAFGPSITKIFALHSQLEAVLTQIGHPKDIQLEHSEHFHQAYLSTKTPQNFSIQDKTTTPSTTAANTQSNDPDLKKAYRSLARKLHPDHRPENHTLDPTRLDELWHATQKSYVSGVLKELQHLEALIETEVNLDSNETDLEHIKELCEQNRIALRSVQHSLKNARKHPAWMFSKDPAIQTELQELFHSELQQELLLLNKDITTCQNHLQKNSSPQTRNSS